MTKSRTGWATRLAVALFLGCFSFIEIYPEVPEAHAADRKNPKAKGSKGNTAAGSPKASADLLSIGGVQQQEGNAAPASKGAAASGKGVGKGRAGSPRGGAGAGNPRGGAGANPSAQESGGMGAAGDDPWTNVNMPEELAQGINFRKPPKSLKFSFNLIDVELIQLVKLISNITGKAFILGGKAPKIKATIYAPTLVNADEAYQAFLSVLQVNGLTVVPAGRYLKILPLGGSTAKNMRILKGLKSPPGDEIVTSLHPLEHVAAEDLAEMLGRFKSTEGDITIYSPTNTLIITDYGSSIRRLRKLIAMLDMPGTGEQIWIEPINHADATELAEKIMEILDVNATAAAPKKKAKKKKGKKARATAVSVSATGGKSGDSKISKILADERTNSIIIVASESSYFRILELVKRLDVEVAGEGKLHVHKLQHADATELAKTLNNLSKSKGAKGKGKGKGQDAGALFEGEVEISPDKATNSLVIVSSLRDYMSLKMVIDQLDQMLRQVFVEAVIMEVSLDKNRTLGLGFHVGNTMETNGESSLIYGSSQPNDSLNSLLLGPGAMSGLAAGLRGPDLEGTEDLLGVGLSIPAFGVALQALQTNTDVNVLSTPNILATDNVEAAITVGENIPVQQGYNPMGSILSQVAGSAGASGAAAGAMGMMGGMGGYGGMGGFSIARQNVGLTLKITPQINDDNQVRLEIDLEIKEVKSLGENNMGPNISQKSATTTSIVADQQTIIIGGLITDNEVVTTSKVPFLGDIPIIGFFFRHKKSLNQKRNLLIFLTPYIIRNAEDFREIFNRKMAERREFMERYTAFEYHRVDPHLDWSRTNGIVSEINHVISTAQKEADLREESEFNDEIDHNPKPAINFSIKKAASDEKSALAPGDTIIVADPQGAASISQENQ